MEFSVRYVRLADGDTIGAERPVLGLRGKKKAYVVINDVDRIHSASIPVKDFDLSAPTMYHGEPYPVTRYLQEIENYKKRKPISAKADHIVSLASLGHPEGIDEDMLDQLPEDLEPSPAPDAKPPESAPRKPAKAKIDPAPASGQPRKPKAPVKSPPAAATGSPQRGRGRPKGSAGGLIATVAAELGADPAKLRKACRAAGMKAPYTSAKEVKDAWRKHGK